MSDTKERPYWWFKGESVEELTKRLTTTADARLEVRIDEHQHMTLRVIGAASGPVAVSGSDINYSHICPPQCGE